MKFNFSKRVFLLATFVLTACAGASSYLPMDKIPAGNSQEVQVNKPYDFVYLSVFDTANTMTKWTPLKTLKDEGLIRLQNTQFSRLDDASLRIVNVRIRRDSSTQTSVFLEKDSQRVVGADEILDAIRKKLADQTKV